VKGEKTLSNYLLRHLADPPGVVPGSLMPPQSGNIRELELMTSYVLSLRSRDLPFEYHPKERIRRTLLGAGREPQSGGQLYSSYCSGCHAPNGRGRNYANLEQRFPAIGSADFLDTAPDEFLLKTLESGRPGRKMPAIRSLDKDLDPAAIGSLIAYLRAFQPPPVPWVSAQEAVSDPSLGRSLYARDCATCHGSSGEGTALGPPLAARDNPARMRRESLHAALVQGIGGTAMPPYRSYDSRAVRSVIDYIASLPPVSTSRQAWKPASGDPRRGREVFDRTCVGCHGARGAGKSGPALDNAGFLNAATTAFISTTIVRGRAGTPMPAFGADSTSFRRLSPEEILHVTAYVKNGLSAGSGKE
jgi:cytochrome c oxidase cbb3-type subunit 3